MSHSPQLRALSQLSSSATIGSANDSRCAQLVAIAGQGEQARRVLILVGQLLEAALVLGAQAGQPPLPAVEALDHVGLDQQLLPAPWRAQRAGDDAIVGSRSLAGGASSIGAGSSARLGGQSGKN